MENEYRHTTISPIKRFGTYGGNPLRMLSLLRRTHAVQYITVIIVQIPIPAKLLPQHRQSRPRKTPFPRRQVLPRTLAFHAGRTFRAYDTFRVRTPASSGIPLIRPPGLWDSPSSSPTGFPGYTRTSLGTPTPHSDLLNTHRQYSFTQPCTHNASELINYDTHKSLPTRADHTIT